MRTLVACLLVLSWAEGSLGAYSTAQETTRQRGKVTPAKLIAKVDPKYPDEARRQRVSGTVKLHAIIRKDGTVAELKVISGDSLLTQAAIDAVQQWRYSPTLLEDKPIEVDTIIEVAFQLYVPHKPKSAQ